MLPRFSRVVVLEAEEEAVVEEGVVVLEAEEVREGAVLVVLGGAGGAGAGLGVLDWIFMGQDLRCCRWDGLKGVKSEFARKSIGRRCDLVHKIFVREGSNSFWGKRESTESTESTEKRKGREGKGREASGSCQGSCRQNAMFVQSPLEDWG